MMQVVAQPQIAKYTVADYHKMLEAGVFPDGVRTELIDGEVYLMPPMGAEHYGILARLTTELSVKLYGKAVPVCQVPIELTDTTEPEPDFIVLEYRDDYYSRRRGTLQESLLFIEVSKPTLDHDRHVKLPKYAQCGVPEVWIINATKEVFTLEIYRVPVGDEYTSIQKLSEGKKASCLEFPDVEIRWW
jgi:Uma2 family endonuclease